MRRSPAVQLDLLINAIMEYGHLVDSIVSSLLTLACDLETCAKSVSGVMLQMKLTQSAIHPQLANLAVQYAARLASLAHGIDH